jgi:3-methyladenine DNA glycosylase AlkD
VSAQGKKQSAPISVEDIARKAVLSVKNQANPEKAVQAQRYFKEQVALYGLSADDVRAIAAGLYREVQPAWTAKQAIDLCEILMPNRYGEVKSVAILMLLRFHKEFERPLFATIKKWLLRDYCDNWAVVDLLCPDSLGVLIDRYPELEKRIKTWTKGPSRWVQRASAVAFIKLARRGKHLDTAYQVSRRLFSARDDLIEKANGWLLREAGRSDMDRLERFLLRHGRVIPRTTLRYAIERFPQAKRIRLLERTRERH